MRNKTKYQWIALISYILGVAACLLGWITHSRVLTAAMLLFYPITLWCIFRPVSRNKIVTKDVGSQAAINTGSGSVSQNAQGRQEELNHE